MRSPRKQILTASEDDDTNGKATNVIQHSIDALLESLSYVGDGGTRYAR